MELLDKQSSMPRSNSVDDFFGVACCYQPDQADEHCAVLEAGNGNILVSKSCNSEDLGSRINSGCLNVYMLAFIQIINLFFIYTWINFSAQRGSLILLAETLLLFTPISGIIGAFFRNRVWLETHHMTSMLLYCSPLFFAMAVWDVQNLSVAGYAFFIYQIVLLFYQYKALKIILQLRRDIKLRSLLDSSVLLVKV